MRRKLVFADRNKIKFLIGLTYFWLSLLIIWFLGQKVKGAGLIELVMVAWSFLFLLPVLMVRFVFREKMRDYGWFWPKNGGGRKIWISLALVVFLLLLFVLKLGGKSYLVAHSWTLGTPGMILFVELFLFPLFLFPMEFGLRSFLQKLFRFGWGEKWEIVFSASTYTLFVFGAGIRGFFLPDVAMIFLLSLYLGWVLKKTGSVFVSALAHWIFLATIDFYVLFEMIKIILRQ